MRLNEQKSKWLWGGHVFLSLRMVPREDREGTFSEMQISYGGSIEFVDLSWRQM